MSDQVCSSQDFSTQALFGQAAWHLKAQIYLNGYAKGSTSNVHSSRDKMYVGTDAVQKHRMTHMVVHQKSVLKRMHAVFDAKDKHSQI